MGGCVRKRAGLGLGLGLGFGLGFGLGLGPGLGFDQCHTSLVERVTEDEALLGLVLEAPAVLNWEAAVEHMSLAPVWQTRVLSRRPTQRAQPSRERQAGSLEASLSAR